MRYFFFLLVLFSFSCNDLSVTSEKEVFKYNEISEINTLDPIYSRDLAHVWAVSQLYNGLVTFDTNMQIIPSVAKSWSISENKLEYRFNLNNNVYFHSSKFFKNENRRVIADDFVYSFDRILDKNNLSPGKWVFNLVDKYYSTNDSTLIIKLLEPFSPFLGILAMQYCSVVPHEVVENSNFNKNPIGTGPFKFHKWDYGNKLVFRKNDNYFENNLPFLDGISISFIKDKNTAFLKFLQGDLDLVSGLDESYIDELLNDNRQLRESYKSRFKLKKTSYLNTEYLGFLINDSSIIDNNLRKAINCGFDREYMIKYLRKDIGQPASKGFVPNGMNSFAKEYESYKYNIKLAKKFLENSKYQGQEIKLNTTSSYLSLCEYIQKSLSEIGINISIEVNPPYVHRQMVASNKLNFFRGSWIADYADPENYFALFYSKNLTPNGPNYFNFNDSKFDSLYNLSVSLNDLNERNKLFKKMNDIIEEKSVMVPLYYDEVYRFYSNDLSDFKTNSFNALLLKEAKKNIK